MFCPSCGAETGSSKFCENCGAPLTTATPEPAGGAYQKTAVEYAEAPDLPGSGTAPASSYQQPYQPPAYQQPSYQPSTGQGRMAPNAAFVLVIVGLILSILGATFLPGLVCSIVGLVLNAGYNKQGLNNPRGTSTKVVGIIGIVVSALVILSFVFLGIFAAILYNEAEEQGIDITTSGTSVSVNSSGVSVSTTSSSSAAASSGATTSSSKYEDAKYHDSDYNPTVYALVELTGKEVSDLLDSYGFSWDGDEDAWVAGDGTIFGETDGSKLLDKAEIEKLPKGAAGEPVIMCLIVEGYDTPKAAYQALKGELVAEQYYEGDDTIAAVVYGPSMVRYLLLVGEGGSGDAGEQMVYLATEASITSGALSTLVGQDVGSTLDEVWQSLVG